MLLLEFLFAALAFGVEDQGKTRLDDRGYRGPQMRQMLGSSGEERPE